MTFNDNSEVTHNINQIDTGDSVSPEVGTYFDNNSEKIPTSVNVLGNSYNLQNLPQPIGYPDDSMGSISYQVYDRIYVNGHEIFLDEQSG